MRLPRPEILLTPKEMSRVDAAAIASGLIGSMLMRCAGEAVAASALRHYPAARRFPVFCGPGNNGGDGYVAATALVRCGADVRVFALGDPDRLSGDARIARENWSGPVERLEAYIPHAGDVVIDALFGAGLARDVPDIVRLVIDKVAETGAPVLAVDLPSGIDGATGKIRGAAFRADHCVTFVDRKPGHVLLPGRSHCGTVEVFDIGIPRRIVLAEAGKFRVNGPALFQAFRRALSAEDHKYRRGHLTVFSGPAISTGAARLSAGAALKAGAGLVTLASPSDALAANGAHLTAVMLAPIDTLADVENWLADQRGNSFVLGPGFGSRDKARSYALAIARNGRSLVLDADGISAFADNANALQGAFAGSSGHLVITPHEGEFTRLFPEIARSEVGKVEKALAAARAIGGIVVYKGADTVIASPDGRAAVEEKAPATLATAGSGDVLAGIIGANLANGMPAFEAACAGVHHHGQAAGRSGEGLTAEDLVSHVLPA
ncbi:NAD(P)H-hydrate dehydratase [Rhizobium sp. WL3]|uniref:NAD(P)H-hydrate dehydratase n=1 Tax=Rhizobium sp. WL3 TaxID=2603277 RepID=UPI0011C2042D|nr:NAD(P)H-hydrate dehydratase [Rhizobium sp. WL3]QEE43883.1 NAD(P)H-hydrate dehydratase [Rhizobium sp. WL3]